MSDLIRTTKEIKQVLEKADKLVEEYKIFLGMEDWDIRVKYCPKTDDHDCSMDAENDKSEYKRVDITIYKVNEYFDSNIFHEMIHGKIGLVVSAYLTALEAYHEQIKDQINLKEEIVTTSLEVPLYKQYLKNKKLRGK